MPSNRTLRKVGLTLWLLAPFVVILILWLAVDWETVGRPEPGVGPGGATPRGAAQERGPTTPEVDPAESPGR